MSAERVMLVHNAYRESGGEDSVVSDELALLRRHGHEVVEWRRSNQEIEALPLVRLASQTLWSRDSYRDVLDLLRTTRPAVVHVHNTFPLISPSLFWACARAGVPVVQSLHNFRLACPQAMLLREEKVCELCLGKTPLPALRHGCYRDSRVQTAVVVGMLALHQRLGTFTQKVTRYIALNEFCKAKFIQAGLPPQRIMIKPNFADVARRRDELPRHGLLFVGRLSAEKGIDVLQRAYRRCSDIALRIAGSGPLSGLLASQPGVEMLGLQSPAQVQAQMRLAVALVLPSICYESFPRVLVEAYGAGLPVIASRIGAMAELVEHGTTGLLFAPGEPNDLAEAMRWASDHPNEMAKMGANARARYESLYTPDINYQILRSIYRSAIEEQSTGKAAVTHERVS